MCLGLSSLLHMPETPPQGGAWDVSCPQTGNSQCRGAVALLLVQSNGVMELQLLRAPQTVQVGTDRDNL